MISAFGVEHTISKGLKPRHLAVLRREAAKPRVLGSAKPDYARDRLNSHGLQEHGKDIAPRMVQSRGMYRDDEKRTMKLHTDLTRLGRRGKTGMRVMEGPKVTYGRRKGHLRLVKNSS